MKSILQKIMLILMLVCVSSTVNAFAENSEEEAELLKVFNVNTVSSEALISRGDFVALTIQAANLDTYDTKSVFNDVEGEQGRYISTAYDHGYVCGDGTGSFNPNDVITTEDAMTICLRILGFKEVLNSSNTTSKDNLINRLNLNKGVVRSDSLSFNQANKLILNMLDSKYMDADYYSNFENISYFLSDDTFMNKAHKIYKIDNAQVQAVKGVNLSGFKDLSKDDVAINGTLYLDEYGMNYDMLGSKGKCYIKESADESSVVYFSRYAGDDAVLTIRSNEIANVKGFDGSDSAAQKSNPFLEYYANNVKKKINIDKKVISYFNYTDTLKLSNADLNPEYGRLLCIDKDNDGIYDVVLVEKYDYYLVSAVDLNENVIQDKYEKRDIKLSEFDDEDIEITYNGRDIELSEIAEGYVLSVMCTYDKFGDIDTNERICIRMLVESVTGTVDTIMKNENQISVSSRTYDIADKLLETVSLGMEATFYLDNNEIIFIDQSGINDGLSYGYFIDCGSVSSSLFKKDMDIKIYDSFGEIKILHLYDKNGVKFTGEISDGKYVSEKKIDADKFKELFAQRQLIKYKAENGVLTSIAKAVDFSKTTDYDGYDLSRFTLDCKNTSTRLYAQMITENYYVNSTVITFLASDDAPADEAVLVGKYDYLGTDVSGLSVEIYDSSDNFIPKVVVYKFTGDLSKQRKTNENFYFTNNAALIFKKYMKSDEEGNYVTTYKAYMQGTIVEITGDEDTELDIWSSETSAKKYLTDLEPGDIVQYSIDSKSKVKAISLLFDSDNSVARMAYYSDPHEHLSAMTTAYGPVKKFVKNSFFSMDIEKLEDRKFAYNRLSAKPFIYIYYSDEGRAEKASTIGYLSDGDMVFVRCTRADVKDIVIFR